MLPQSRRSLREAAAPEIDGREGLKSLELLIAMYLSARDGGAPVVYGGAADLWNPPSATTAFVPYDDTNADGVMVLSIPSSDFAPSSPQAPTEELLRYGVPPRHSPPPPVPPPPAPLLAAADGQEFGPLAKTLRRGLSGHAAVRQPAGLRR